MSTNRLMRRLGQTGVVLTAAGLAVLVGGGIASAHVTAKIIGEPAAQGGFTKITFRVPNEEADAGTVKLEVQFPAATPIASLSTKAVPGWTATVTRAKLPTPIKTDDGEVTEAVSTITWTANQGVKIAPGEFGEFEVSGGPMPNTDTLILPAIQTYDNGKIVRWIDQPAAPGAQEPEHPAPTIALTKAADKGAGMDSAAPANNAPVAQAGNSGSGSGGSQASSGSTSDTTARWLGGIGLVVGALGLGVGAGATLRARKVTAAAKAGDGS